MNHTKDVNMMVCLKQISLCALALFALCSCSSTSVSSKDVQELEKTVFNLNYQNLKANYKPVVSDEYLEDVKLEYKITGTTESCGDETIDNSSDIELYVDLEGLEGENLQVPIKSRYNGTACDFKIEPSYVEMDIVENK